MKVTVDPARLATTSAALRQATGMARQVRQGVRGMLGYTVYTGDAELGGAVDELLQAWGTALESVADQGETLARMLDLAGSAYTAGDDAARRGTAAAGGTS